MANKSIIFAVPRGRILGECKPLLTAAGIEPEPELFDNNSSKLRFATNEANLTIVRARSFDVATFVTHGAAQLGICGEDVLLEHPNNRVYAPLDLGIGKCRISIAEPKALLAQDNPEHWSHIQVATKYPNITRQHFAKRGVFAECIKLHGAIELAPRLGMCPRIVDLVASGKTLAANDLTEVEVLCQISSLLIVNRIAVKIANAGLLDIIARLKNAITTSST